MKPFLFVLLIGWAGLAEAAPFVCFTGDAPSSVEAVIMPAAWNPSCQVIENIGVGIDATSLVLSGVGFGLACTGIGVPATLWLEGIAIGVQAVGLVIGQLPCDSSVRDAEIKAMAEQVVCEELSRQGISCSYLN